MNRGEIAAQGYEIKNILVLILFFDFPYTQLNIMMIID